MPKYEVTVKFRQERRKEITVWAKNEAEAEEKACEIVEDWDDVIEAEAEDVAEA